MSLRCDKLEISLSNITASTQIEPLILNHLLGVNLLCGEMSDGTQHGIPLTFANVLLITHYNALSSYKIHGLFLHNSSHFSYTNAFKLIISNSYLLSVPLKQLTKLRISKKKWTSLLNFFSFDWYFLPIHWFLAFFNLRLTD